MYNNNKSLKIITINENGLVEVYSTRISKGNGKAEAGFSLLL